MKLKELLKKKKVFVTIAVAAFIVIVALLWGRNGSKGTVYEEITVTRGDIQPSILSTGTVSPENRLEIKPPIAGRIDSVLVEEGDVVTKGEMLVKMSSTERAALLDAAQAQGRDELKRWEAYYKPAPIMAPIDGTIIVRSVESGQTVTSSDVILVMSDRLTVKARVDETDIAKIALKQKADIILDAYPDEIIPGQVDKIAYDSKTVNNVTTYIVDVLPDETPEAMRSGMTANVNFYLESKNGVLFVPTNTVHMKDDRSYVLVFPKNRVGQPIEKDVKTGVTDGNKVEITSGLEEGEKVLIEKMKWRGGRSDKTNPFFPSRPKKNKT